MEDLYYGKCYPSVRIKPNDPQFMQITQQISDIMETLKMKLPENEYTLIEEIWDLHDILNSMSSASAYIYGFKMGAAMIIEVLGWKEGVIHKEC
nr:DUF6809 family protein [Paenibacillus monticola]